MSVLTGNVIAVGLIVTALFIPFHTGIAVTLFVLGILVWLTTAVLEREKRLVDLDMTFVKEQGKKQEYKIGKRIG